MPAPTSQPIDLETAVHKLDDDRIALTVEAWKLHLTADALRKQRAADALAKQKAATSVERARANEAEGRAAMNEWWAGYGVLVGAGGILVLEAIVAGVVFAVKR